MCRARHDLESASGTVVNLRGRTGTVGLHVPFAVALGFGSRTTKQRAVQIELCGLVCRAATSRTVGAGHGTRLSGREMPLVTVFGASGRNVRLFASVEPARRDGSGRWLGRDASVETTAGVHLLQPGLFEIQKRLRAGEDTRRIRAARPGLKQHRTFGLKHFAT